MGEISIEDALGRIRSEKVKERNDGLADLKHILTQNRRSSKLSELSDKGYHKLFEALFRIATADKSNYLKATKATTKSTISSRLSACANVFRIAVEVGVRTLRSKTVKALIDHITQALPTASELYCEPLVDDYVKALRVALEWQPHLEHLSKDEWLSLLQFCTDGIHRFTSSLVEYDSGPPNGSDSLAGRLSRSATPATSSRVLGHERKTNNLATRTLVTTQSKNSVDELVFCLSCLLRASNAPLLEGAQATVSVLLDLLQSSSNVGRAHQAALMSLNSLIAATLTEDMLLGQQIARSIITIVRRFWQAKATALKEEMLIAMIYSEAYIPSLLLSAKDDDLMTDLEGLLDVFQAEYCKRTEREQLQIEDLDLFSISSLSQSPVPFAVASFGLRSVMPRGEHAWALLDVSSSIVAYVAANTPSDVETQFPEEDALPRKRQKIAKPIESLLQQARLSSISERLFALQELAFAVDKLSLDADGARTIVESLVPNMSDDNSPIAIWAMLAVSSIALHGAPLPSFPTELWLQVWRLAARHTTSVTTCRAACHLMTILLDISKVQYADIADIVDSMVSSVDLNGPATFVDSAASIWISVLSLRGKQSPGLISDTSERVLRWLFIRWNASKLDDRHQILQLSQQCRAYNVVQLISAILGLPLSKTEIESNLGIGPISQARLYCVQNEKLIRYLLSAGDDLFSLHVRKPASDTSCLPSTLSEAAFQRLSNLTVSFLLAEISIILRVGPLSESEDSRNAGADIVHPVSSLCIVAYAIMSCPQIRDSSEIQQLRVNVNKLRARIIKQIPYRDDSHEAVDGLLLSFVGSLGFLEKDSQKQTLMACGAKAMARCLDQSFWEQVNDRRQERNTHVDYMAMDDDFQSQGSHARNESVANEVSHDALSAMTNISSFRASMTAKICLVGSMESSENPSDREVAPSFIDYLTSLQPSSFLACRPFFRELFDSSLYINEQSGCVLLEYLGQDLLQSYDYERSEVSLGVCLDIMTGLTDLWAVSDDRELSYLGSNLYEWFIDIALGHGISSPHVYTCISTMLERIIKVSPEYAKSSTLPSARTSLFRVLEEGNVAVKFHTGSKISNVFEMFILKEHSAILEDVISSLPSERDWIEGIALRLFFLAHLASSWSTLLRRCVYAIFETPGHVDGSVGYAKYCLKYVASALGLENPKELFKLFVSQIIYTWLETQPLRSIPYSIFGYGSLQELIHDVQDELTSQLAMRGKEDEATRMAQELGQALEELLRTSFARSAAYSIARDIALPPARDSQGSGAEKRLRRLIGKEEYNSLISNSFAEIAATFFRTIDQEDGFEKGLQRWKVLGSAHEIYMEITSIGASGAVLPANQQPSFKAGYLVDELEHLCQRTSYDLADVWTPELYTYIFRALLDTVHPSLGSLHACAVIRKVRILVCFVGETALQDYPLEMALHALRPFLTDMQCSEDVIGLIQYLLSKGSEYLLDVPSFLAGFAVSTFASMKAFLKSSQDSTTQESQFIATITKAEAFHSWLSVYLDRYTSPHLEELAEGSFKAIVKASNKIRVEGNAMQGTYESDLLLELVEDQRSGRLLVNQPSSDLIFSLLCGSFEVPSTFRDDILGMDKQAAKYASAIWRTCEQGACGPSYLLWAGRVLGRAYSSTGFVDKDLIREVRLDPPQRFGLMHGRNTTLSSRSNILWLLSNTLLVDDRKEVGVAENVLRTIMSATRDQELEFECQQLFPTSLLKALAWRTHMLPTERVLPRLQTLHDATVIDNKAPFRTWTRQLCVALANSAPEDPVLLQLTPVLMAVGHLPEQMFPYILHLVLHREADGNRNTSRVLSEAAQQWLRTKDEATKPHVRLFIRAILYLRSQPFPHENAKTDRSQWLDLDYHQVAIAAARCQMFKTALLFLEIHFSNAAKRSRRSSSHKVEQPTALLLDIYRNINDRDSFYGIHQPSSLTSMMDRLEYENAGFKSLSFRGAHYDSQIRLRREVGQMGEESMIRTLDSLDLNGLSQSLLGGALKTSQTSDESMMRTARKLEQWDVPYSSTGFSNASLLFRAFQSIHNATNIKTVKQALDVGFSDAMNYLLKGDSAGSSISATLSSLSVLTEMDEVLSSTNGDQLFETWERFQSRDSWMVTAGFEHFDTIISCRETLFSILSKRNNLLDLLQVSQRGARAVETQALLASSKISRYHGMLQNALSTATYLSHLIEPCEEIGLNVVAAVRYEGANVLWDQGEMTASVRMLQELEFDSRLQAQDIQVGKPEILAKLGHRVSEARSEKPDEIITRYLEPAIRELHGRSDGEEAGQVFHEFASFCDQQLQNSDNLEDFQRIQKLRERKEAEVRDLDKMLKAAGSQAKEKDNLKSHRAKAKQWFDLDNREYQRLKDSREAFLRQSLENYLLCLKACDTYDTDALRFSALWLEHSENEIANTAVSSSIIHVGSRKFAPLMNQWTSRLQDTKEQFQILLASLVFRICIDHPYHGMYQIFASSKTKGGKDDVALSRHAAANNIVNRFKSNKKAGPIWLAIHNSNINFVRFSVEKQDESKFKPGSKIALRKFVAGSRLEQDVTNHTIPPPTMKIRIRTDCDYSGIPPIAKFQPEFTLASGISAPKILTAITSDGRKHKLLVKSGNDDLRQDSIMEQVFEQVSNLLSAHRATSQRNLAIRTYKVLPLTATSGIIEFVQNTIPLHDYLMPAHQRHFPSDMKPNVCRKQISDAQSKSVDARVKAFRAVTDRFHPVMRHFFMERFENPDDWFEKRLAYTRSTAAISILGHVLGLGDRHGHNILLDEKTGEVVHIDLGIAFEQGRILPVPEVVPFRLTRDLVDGMGITKTEGVFRRCCEFTLDALRNESYSIMTILDVLRYDPLYNWSLSPLRLKRMQDAQTEAPPPPTDAAEAQVPSKKDNEPGEADRALTVVAKKLSKSLSVAATVNELIQQATDERNLALLFCGWAAYA